jgi:cation diffusion facilitator CzcD-associated flavoprotein CzcO
LHLPQAFSLGASDVLGVGSGARIGLEWAYFAGAVTDVNRRRAVASVAASPRGLDGRRPASPIKLAFARRLAAVASSGRGLERPFVRQNRKSSKPSPQVAEHFDVVVIGAGVSGLGSACHLRQQCPGMSFVLLERESGFGGTWRTHRYPGIRSDSATYTYAYRFKPWRGSVYASADEIRSYLGEVIEENGLAPHIRYQHKAVRATWSSIDNLWTLTVERTDSGDVLQFTTHFLWVCSGYYRHEDGYTPEWPGMARFKGPIIHPQRWPVDLDSAGKEVLVIGSGATAATMVPALAPLCRHVTVLQRSPSYYFAGTTDPPLAAELRSLGIDESWIFEIMRRRYLADEEVYLRRSAGEPETVAAELIANARSHLGPDYDVDTHFTPHYRPWQQRLCLIPDADLYRTIRSGKATMVTDEIETFTETGVLLRSGRALDADIVVTATGLRLLAFGGIEIEVDAAPVAAADTVTYHGMMFTGLPNLAWVFGYIRATWTMRVDLVADFVCKLLNHMEAHGLKRVVPLIPEADRGMTLHPWLRPENFNPGYVARGQHVLPKCGDQPKWQHSHDYYIDRDRLPAIPVDDEALVYS